MSKKHTVIMVLSCLIPLGALLAIRLLNIQVNSGFAILIILLCPLSHLLMRGSMKHGDHAPHSPNNEIINVIPMESDKG